MSEILILGIYKNNKYSYEVIGYIKSIMRFCKFQLRDIFNKEVRTWDIGAITKVSGFQSLGEYNIRVIGDSILIRHLEKSELREFLNSKKIDFMKFIKNSNIRFCVIKPDVIKKIYIMNNRCYIEIISEGIDRKIQIKDLRWVKYWEYISNKKKEFLEDKEEHYRKFLSDRETYFIGYKDVIEDKSRNRFKKNTSYINIASIFWF